MNLKNLKHYLRDRRGVASIEAALGIVAILAASALALDLYRLSSTQTTTMHTAVTLADSVSRDAQLDADFVQKLAEFLHQEQFPTSNAVFVVSAVYKDPDTPTAPPSVLWTETVKFELTPCNPDNESCCDATLQKNEIGVEVKDQPASLPDVFSMADGELAIVAEVCVERTNTAMSGAVYAHYIVPPRCPQHPSYYWNLLTCESLIAAS